MSEPEDQLDKEGNGDEPIDQERMMRSIERIQMLPKALLVIAVALVAVAIICWLISRFL